MYGRLQGCTCGHQRQLHAESRPAACLRCDCAAFSHPTAMPTVTLVRGQRPRRARANRRGIDA